MGKWHIPSKDIFGVTMTIKFTVDVEPLTHFVPVIGIITGFPRFFSVQGETAAVRLRIRTRLDAA
jgi:hypothetical protein